MREMKQAYTVTAETSTNSAIIHTGPSDACADVLRKQIIEYPDTVCAKGKTYYISNKGNDANSGLTPELAWASIEAYKAHINQIEFGDAVLFERGGIYRGTFYALSGVSYGAYGLGEKPKIYGSRKNSANINYWIETDIPNIWRYTEKIELDVGNIVFNDGCFVGVKKINALTELVQNFDFFHNNTTGELFIYMNGNPAALYNSVEICKCECIISSPDPIHDVVLENLCVQYGGAHGIAFSNGVKDITIRGCVACWIGGSLQNPTTRFGNAIQFWDGCDSITIKNCWIYQIYDTGLTHQGGAGIQSNIKYQGNLIEYCVWALETFFDSEEGVKNILYENNILRFAGFGWGMQRPNDGANSLFCAWGRNLKAENFVIRNNIFDQSSRFLIVDYGSNPTYIVYEGNTYYQANDEIIRWQNDTVLFATEQEKMEQQIALVDFSAKEVKFITTQ